MQDEKISYFRIRCRYNSIPLRSAPSLILGLFKFLYPNLHVCSIFAYFVLLLFKVNFLIRPPSSKHHNRNNPHLGWSSKQNNCKTPISWQIRHEQFKAKRMKATCINNRSCKRMTTILLDSGVLECPKNGGRGHTIAQSICTRYSCFEKMGGFVTLKKIQV